MKLLIIVPSTSRGGVEEYSLKIAAHSKQAGWDVNLAFPKKPGTESIIADAGKAGINYHKLNVAETKIPTFQEISSQHQALLPILKRLIIPRLKFDWSIIPHFFRTLFLLIKIRPKAVLLILPWPEYGFGSILACSFLKIPSLLVFQLAPHTLSIKKWKKKLYHWAHRRKQTWVGVSKSNCRCISQSFGLPPEKVLCIYNGASFQTNRGSLTDNIRKRVKQELGLSEESTMALTVARLNDQKGHDFLIPAIPHLKEEFPNLKFVWVGDGEKKAYLQQLLKEYNCSDQVLFLGYRSDVPRLLQAADLFVFPTYYEGQPFALLEAMAYGAPIITSSTDGIPEVITHKVQGLLSRKGDSADLLEAIRWALRNPSQMATMAQKAQIKVQDFSQEKMLDQTFALLNERIDGKTEPDFNKVYANTP